MVSLYTREKSMIKVPSHIPGADGWVAVKVKLHGDILAILLLKLFWENVIKKLRNITNVKNIFFIIIIL